MCSQKRKDKSALLCLFCVLLILGIFLLSSCAGGASGGSSDDAQASQTSISVSLPQTQVATGRSVKYEKSDIATFTVTINSGSFNSTKSADAGQTITFSSIPVGTYSVVAYGKKSDGTPAARGTATVTVVAGENSVTTVKLSLLYHHTVSFFVNDALYGTPQEITDGYTASKPTDPELAGHTFSFWAKGSPDSTTPFSFSSEITEDTDLYAVFDIEAYFTGTVDEFLNASFGTTSSNTNPYVVVLTDVTDSNIAQIGQKLLGGTMKDVYISLDLSQCTGLTTIPVRAFAGCSAQWNTNSTSSNTVRGSLVSVIIPDGVTTIERSAFFQCLDLASVTLPDSITSIGDNAFNQAKIQGTLHLPASLVTIGTGAFRYTSGITKVEAPEGLDLSNAEFSTSNIVYY